MRHTHMMPRRPFGHVPPSRQLVATDVRGFRALAVPDWAWVLDNERNLWLCSAPFGSTRQQIDGNVLAFHTPGHPAARTPRHSRQNKLEL